MEIECSCCQARYRMKESMLRGFREAEVRCRKCGGTIAVLAPGTAPRTPAAKVPGDRPGGTRPHPQKDKELPLVERQDPSTGHASPGLGGEDGKTQTHTALAEEPDADDPVPDNVYTLDLFRGGQVKKLPARGYDISGSILPYPTASSATQESAERSPEVAEPLEELRSIRSNLLEGSIRWQEEGLASAPSEAPPAAPGKMPVSEKSSADKPRLRRAFSVPMNHRATNIAIVYLLLLLLGGFGYMLVRFFSQMIYGGGA